MNHHARVKPLMKKRTKLESEELPALCRRRHLYGIGLSKGEVAKMVRAGSLTEKKTRPHQRAYFDRKQVLEVIYGK